MTTIAVLGAGYVGLTAGACFSHLGHDVVVSDINQIRIKNLQDGLCPIVEKELPELLETGLRSGTLRFVSDNSVAVSQADFTFICLPTPQSSDGCVDTSYVQAAAKEISPFLKPGSVVVTKSTVPVGSTKIIEEMLGRSDIAVVSNPEFQREGTAVRDFLNPDRVVIGSSSETAARSVAELYSKLNCRILITDPASAETIKYAANAFLATKISYMNAIAAVCECVNADILSVIEGIGSDKRIGPEFLNPGPGWGGSCFPKDTIALVKIAETAGYDFSLLRGVITVNAEQLQRVTEKILSRKPAGARDFKVGVLGLTFKAGTDDLRDSPSITIIRNLQEKGALVSAFDPTVKTTDSIKDLVDVRLAPMAIDALTDCDVMVILTEWPEFALLEPSEVLKVMRSRSVVDARNILDRDKWVEAGFNYQGIGRS